MCASILPPAKSLGVCARRFRYQCETINNGIRNTPNLKKRNRQKCKYKDHGHSRLIFFVHAFTIVLVNHMSQIFSQGSLESVHRSPHGRRRRFHKEGRQYEDISKRQRRWNPVAVARRDFRCGRWREGAVGMLSAKCSRERCLEPLAHGGRLRLGPQSTLAQVGQRPREARRLRAAFL